MQVQRASHQAQRGKCARDEVKQHKEAAAKKRKEELAESRQGGGGGLHAGSNVWLKLKN
jgi:hypothetical protein